MTFQKLKKYTSWTIGSIVSDTGSEYLYGYDPADGLMWLERSGVEYTPSDKVWREAERFIMANGNDESIAWHEAEAPEIDSEELKLQRVTRAATTTLDDQMGSPQGYGDVVGDTRPGQDVSDDDISSFAERFLSGEIEMEEPDVEVR